MCFRGNLAGRNPPQAECCRLGVVPRHSAAFEACFRSRPEIHCGPHSPARAAASTSEGLQIGQDHFFPVHCKVVARNQKASLTGKTFDHSSDLMPGYWPRARISLLPPRLDLPWCVLRYIQKLPLLNSRVFRLHNRQANFQGQSDLPYKSRREIKNRSMDAKQRFQLSGTPRPLSGNLIGQRAV